MKNKLYMAFIFAWLVFLHVAIIFAIIPPTVLWQVWQGEFSVLQEHFTSQNIAWIPVLLFIPCVIIGNWSITFGYHRHFAHKSFKAKEWLRWVVAIIGSSTTQGSALAWGATHRKHHLLADKEGDPHSPHYNFPNTRWGKFCGFMHSQWLWIVTEWATTNFATLTKKYAKQDRETPVLKYTDKYYHFLVLFWLALPWAIGYCIGGTTAAWAWFWILGPVRMVTSLHLTGFINSICHIYGDVAVEQENHAKNVGWWWVVILILGEGWHNWHHAYQKSAKMGLGKGQLDITYGVIWLFAKFGWVWNVQLINPLSKKYYFEHKKT